MERFIANALEARPRFRAPRAAPPCSGAPSGAQARALHSRDDLRADGCPQIHRPDSPTCSLHPAGGLCRRLSVGLAAHTTEDGALADAAGEAAVGLATIRAQVMDDLIGVDAGVDRRIDLQDDPFSPITLRGGRGRESECHCRRHRRARCCGRIESSENGRPYS
jgi:hypothetical protein